MTTAQDRGKVVSLKHRPPLPPGNAPGTHFCWRLSRPQGHGAIGRITSMKNSNDTSGRVWVVSVLQAEACNTDTTQTLSHQIFNTERTENKTTDVVIQQNSRKFLMMDILISETCWAYKKWNKIVSDIKLVFYSSTITMMRGQINIRFRIYQFVSELF